MSEEGRGVAGIANMLQITRIHNAVGSAGYMRRSLIMFLDKVFVSIFKILNI